MTFYYSESVVKEIKGMLALHEAFGDFSGKLTCLSTLGHHYLNVGQFSEALESFRQFFKEFMACQNREDPILELVAVAANGFATTARYRGYLELSLYYYLSSLETYLQLGQYHAALKEYFYLQYFSFRQPMYLVIQDKLNEAREVFLSNNTCKNDLIKLENLLEILWRRHRIVTSMSAWKKRKLRLEKELISHLDREISCFANDQDLDKEIKEILHHYHVELQLLKRCQEVPTGTFVFVDDLLEMIVELQKNASYDFLKAQYYLLASKIALIGGLIEDAYELFSRAMTFARTIGFKTLLLIGADELQRLRDAVDILAMVSKPSRKLTANLLELMRVFQFIRTLEIGLTTSYLEAARPLEQREAASFMQLLDEEQKLFGTAITFKYRSH